MRDSLAHVIAFTVTQAVQLPSDPISMRRAPEPVRHIAAKLALGVVGQLVVDRAAHLRKRSIPAHVDHAIVAVRKILKRFRERLELSVGPIANSPPLVPPPVFFTPDLGREHSRLSRRQV